MNIKNAILVLTLVVQVRSDCDGYFMCLSGLVKDFLSGNKSEINNEEIVNVGSFGNESFQVFSLSDIGRSLSQALSEVTTIIKDEVKGIFNIDDQTDVHKDIGNETEIHVRSFSLNNISNHTNVDKNLNATDTAINIHQVLINNLTKFNDELNALKVEIENNLQAELESFIAQVLENDSVDWVGATEDSFDTELTTTEYPYPAFKDAVETTTQIADNNVVDVNVFADNTSIKDDSNANSPENIKQTLTNTSSVSTDASNTITNMTTTIPAVTTAKLVIELTSEHSIKSTDTTIIPKISTHTTINPITTSPVVSTTIAISKTTEATRKETTTTTITPITTKKDTTIRSTTELNKIKQDTHTKAPINYKLLENIKVNEISNEDMSYYEIQDDNMTDYPIIDYVDLYKDTTNEDLDYVPTVRPIIKSELENEIQNENELTNADNGYYTNDTSHPTSVLPWIAAIFIKNGTGNQFDYYCDGVLLSEQAVLTAARCLQRANETVDANDVIVFLGKRSLQNTADGESIHKVKKLSLHSNFSLQGNVAQNDLAVLLLEDPAVFSDSIQPACLLEDGETDDSLTTAWGEKLSIIRFVAKNKTCEKDPMENTFCATYASTVPLCPSYGGVYAALQAGHWCVGGVRSADVTSRGLCFEHTVSYTDLSAHAAWLRRTREG